MPLPRRANTWVQLESTGSRWKAKIASRSPMGATSGMRSIPPASSRARPSLQVPGTHSRAQPSCRAITSRTSTKIPSGRPCADIPTFGLFS